MKRRYLCPFVFTVLFAYGESTYSNVVQKIEFTVVNDAIVKNNRPKVNERLFRSKAVDEKIERVCKLISNA